jgi:hypothetical protein
MAVTAPVPGTDEVSEAGTHQFIPCSSTRNSVAVAQEKGLGSARNPQ